MIVDTWQWTPFVMLIALAGLTAVPKYLYEAAEIDQRRRSSTSTGSPPHRVAAAAVDRRHTGRSSPSAWTWSSSSPAVARAAQTETLSYNVYKVAFFGFDTGRASAYGILMVIVVTIAAQFYLRYLNKLQER